MLLYAFLLSAFAQDAVSLQLLSAAQVGHGAPALTLTANTAGSLDVSLSCAGRSFGGHRALTAGSQWELPLTSLPQGTHRCSGQLSLAAEDGTTGELPLGFQVRVLPPLELRVEAADLSLADRRLTVHASRPITHLAVEVFGEGGARLGEGEASASSTIADIEWHQAPDEVLRIHVLGWDQDELPGQVDLFPWSYAVPHEDVVFASGSAQLPDAELPKLEEAWRQLGMVRAKYGSVATVRLYVAGYTDTVGAAAGNITLSQQRAKAIAAWFRQRGFADPIAWQGFGEEVLAVPTADETDEPRNRRVLYLVAAEAPPRSAEVPRTAWTPL